MLSDRRQGVGLNEQSSNWSCIEAGALQGYILGLLLFLLYISDLSEDLDAVTKLFADDTSLFSVVDEAKTTSVSLNADVTKISQCVCHWKMLFDADTLKQAQEVAFSRKKGTTNHGSDYFNNMPIAKENIQKHWSLFLDVKLNFLEHINDKIKKENKGINVIINSMYHYHVLH